MKVGDKIILTDGRKAVIRHKASRSVFEVDTDSEKRIAVTIKDIKGKTK